MFQYAVVFAILAIAHGSVVVPALPAAGEVHFRAAAPYAHEFGYHVADPLRANYQSHVQARLGDAVSGSYSLLESDGTTRVVDYTADGLTGFNANVRHEATAVAAVTPVVAEAKIATVAPVAPIHEYGAPTAHVIPEVSVPLHNFHYLPHLFRGYGYGYSHNLPYAFKHFY